MTPGDNEATIAAGELLVCINDVERTKQAGRYWLKVSVLALILASRVVA